MKKAAVILLLVLLTAAFALPGSADMNKYSTVFMDTFDTVISLIGYAENQETFNARAAETHAMYLHLHKMFDTYNSYADEGIVSVYDVNLKAASEPVQVDPILFGLLTFCKSHYELVKGQTNVAMGSVLSIWHEYREAGLDDPDNAKLPQILGKFRIQAGLVIALIAVILVAVLFYKMVFGYKMRVVGSNPWFAKACGINMTATIICAQLFGGALAGLGGTCEILGNYDRYNWVATTQHGFDGLMVAVLARKNPLLVPVAACLLAYIRIGADVVNSKGDIPIEFITVIQGIVILMVAAEEFMGRYKKKLIYKAAEEELAAKEKAEKESAASKGKEE